MNSADIEHLKLELTKFKTEYLISIWVTNNRDEWRAEAFEAIREILAQRGASLSRPGEPVKFQEKQYSYKPRVPRSNVTEAEKTEKPAIVFAGNISEADLIRSILANNGIKAFLWNERIGTWMPYITSPGGVNAVKVAVAESDFSEASRLIDDIFYKAPEAESSTSAGRPWKCPKCGENIESQFIECWNCQTRQQKDQAVGD